MQQTQTGATNPDDTLKNSGEVHPNSDKPTAEEKQPKSFGDTELNKGLEAQAKDEETAS